MEETPCVFLLLRDSCATPDPDLGHDGQAVQQHDGGQQLDRQLQQVSEEDAGGTHNHPDQPSQQFHEDDDTVKARVLKLTGVHYQWEKGRSCWR